MPYFPPNTGWSLPGQSDEPSAETSNQMESMGFGTQHGLSQTEMFNYLLQFYHSHAPAPVFGPAQNPVQAVGFNSADLGSLPQDDYSNGLTGGFNEPSTQSHIANMHGINQTHPNLNPPVQDPIPGQPQEQGPAPRNPLRAPRRGRRNARSRARPYERPLENTHSIGVFRCEWKNCNCDCGQTFNRKGDRDRHVDTQHLERYPVACLACGAIFKRRDNLDHHWKTVHRGNDSLLAARGGLD